MSGARPRRAALALLAALLAGCAGPAPPAGDGPRFYYVAAGDTTRLTAVDWSGRRLGTLDVPRQAPWPLSQSSDGSRFLVDGRVLGGSPPTALPGPALWGDRGSQLCAVWPMPGPAPQPASLYTIDPGTGYRPVSALGDTSILATPGLESCSPSTDLAVVVDRHDGRVTGIRAFRLSSGRQVFSQPGLETAAIMQVAVSPDSRLLSVTTSSSGRSRIFDVLSGSLVGSVEGCVMGFSGDGRRVVTTGVERALSTNLMDWRTGVVLWTQQGRPDAIFAQPGGGGVLLKLTSNPPAMWPRGDLWLVDSAGHPQLVAERVVPALPLNGEGY